MKIVFSLPLFAVNFFSIIISFQIEFSLVNEDIMWENQVKFRACFNPSLFNVAKFIPACCDFNGKAS